MKWYDSLSVLPAVSQLLQRGTELAHSEAKRYSKDFGQENREKLKYFAESLVKKVLHGPISYIKSFDSAQDKNGREDEPSSEQLQAVDLINKMFLSREKQK
jgi:glutamyl-tRNA reductase